MTDRIKGFIVTLDMDIREDDVEIIRLALSQVRHVIDVTPLVANHDHYMAREQAKFEFRTQMYDLLRELE